MSDDVLVPAAESTHLSDTSAEYQDAMSTSFDVTELAGGGGVETGSLTMQYDEGNVPWDPDLVAGAAAAAADLSSSSMSSADSSVVQ